MQEEIKGRYYAIRASQERALADSSTDTGVRQIHVEMATRYEMLARGDIAPTPSPQAVE